MPVSKWVLFVCEKYYLRFYAPLADRLVRSGFEPLWIMLDGPAPWKHGSMDPRAAVESLAGAGDVPFGPDDIDALCLFERRVFERPEVFRDNYRYTVDTVRSLARARRLAAVWYQLTVALLSRFRPRAVFLWNGRYLPYSAVSAACEATGQPFFTSEIGWVPGTIFVDRGRLSTTTTDLTGRTFESAAAADGARADAFLRDYTARKATMVSQTLMSASALRQRLLGEDGRFLLAYGCQVDWDTNVVIGARRFHSNESAVAFLTECAAAVPGARVAIKTHPLDSEKKEERLQQIVGDRGTVVSDVHPHTLIEAADCVAVRNSTLGFEALCYGKPLMLLEQAKYRHPALTLDAPDGDTAAAHLVSIAGGQCHVPDPATLRRFVLHLLDHYLIPVPYDYFFDPTKLDLLSHFTASDSYAQLEHVLSEADPPAVGAVDARVSRALARCRVRREQPASFLQRGVRKLARWMHSGRPPTHT